MQWLSVAVAGWAEGAVAVLAAGGARVVVIGRNGDALSTLAAQIRGVVPVVGDAGDEPLAEKTLCEETPELVVVCAGARPVLRPLQDLSWDEFQVNWQADTKIAFVWLRQALRLPWRAMPTSLSFPAELLWPARR